MGTEVLRPQNCLIERIRVPHQVLPRRKSSSGNASTNFHPKPNRRAAARSDRSDHKKRASQAAEISKRSAADDLKITAARGCGGGGRGLVMGQVTILRRGESLDSKARESGNGMIACGTGRLGPDPEMVPKQIRIGDVRPIFSTPPPPPPPPLARSLRPDMYAGSGFSMSPSPSSLPLPSFSKKKQISAFDDSATKDLRRLLRLD